MKRAFIVAYGTLSSSILTDIRKDDVVIGVDHGAISLLEKGIIPHIAVGDFDSVTPGERKRITDAVADVRAYPVAKDDTDLALALEAAAREGCREAVIVGATGGRLDHLIGNVFLLEEAERLGMDGVIRDEDNECLLCPTRRTILYSSRYVYLSVIPLTKSARVTLTGVLYPARRLLIRRGQTVGISNEIVGKKAVVTVHSGKTLIIRSRD